MREADADRRNEDVQRDGAGKAAAEAIGGSGRREWRRGSCGSWGSCLSRGWVTMLMLVMPACFTASMTEAKAPKGTLLVGADVDDALGGIAVGELLSRRGEVVDVDGLVLQEDVLVLVDGDDGALFGELVDGAGVAGRRPRCRTAARAR